jgi:ABC-type bacteriocin/lantibiotic exporter with double-glycine peptidase domain
MKIPLAQKDNFGCGLACIAFLTNQTYEKVVNDLGRKKAKTKGFYCREITVYLKKLGYQTEFHYLNKKWRNKIYQDKTIVFIRRSKKYPYGHYLIRYQNYWMDSWINFQKNKDIKNAKAGFRKKLPGKPIYGIFLR